MVTAQDSFSFEVQIPTVYHPRTTIGDSTSDKNPLQFSSKTLNRCLDIFNFSSCVHATLANRLLLPSYELSYSDQTDKPESLTISLRAPIHSRSLVLLMRIRLSSLSTIAVLSCAHHADLSAMHALVSASVSLLLTHPLHLVRLVYEQRFASWMDWMLPYWKDVRVYETATAMTLPAWEIDRRSSKALQARLEALQADPHVLLRNIYGTMTALCHGDTIMGFARRMGEMGLQVMEVVERERGVGGLGLGRRDRAVYEQGVRLVMGRCESAGGRMAEQKMRLQSQVNVAHNLLVLEDSKLSRSMAKDSHAMTVLMALDSKMVKKIAFLTLIFLPATLVTSIWDAGIFVLEGDMNWKVWLATTLAVTTLAIALWELYGVLSRRKSTRSRLHEDPV
ncbi:hypothetical protein B0T17DRAFT_263921 [Bombardia bombarda]|uniref:Uncharacterized protein n=1 Tax=Bombardia bombarda TaxID=252184 RepID=A0AA39X0R1_9PEZI|nr:hypothetical protein B0T17DRAFT_263921 [Bombardia bombarda]